MLQAGAAIENITPWAGVHLSGAGFCEYRPAETVLDPLYAKAVVLDNGRKRIVVITLDVTIITEEYAGAIRREVSQRCGVAYEAVLVHALQTHSAPGMGKVMLDPDLPLELPEEMAFAYGGEPGYSQFAAEKAVLAARRAAENLRPVKMGFGRGIADKLAFNRRLVTRRGNVVMPGMWNEAGDPAGPTDLLYYEGPTDPEIGVICLRDSDMNMVAVLLHFTCHPVNVFNQKRSWNAVSADWPGAWSAETQKAFGGDCVPLVLNGCCGNQNPWDPFEPDFKPDHLRMGRALFGVSESVVKRMRFTEDDTLDFRCDRVNLQYREVPAERKRMADKILSEYPGPADAGRQGEFTHNDWFMAASTKSIEICKKRSPEMPYEIHVFRLGGSALAGLPGEPFVEGQLALKTSSPAAYVIPVHCTSQYIGYLPIREAYARGGHEANELCTYWAKTAPGSLEKVVEKARDMIDELFKEN